MVVKFVARAGAGIFRDCHSSFAGKKAKKRVWVSLILKNQSLICTQQELFLEGIGPGVTLILFLFFYVFRIKKYLLLLFLHKKVVFLRKLNGFVLTNENEVIKSDEIYL